MYTNKDQHNILQADQGEQAAAEEVEGGASVVALPGCSMTIFVVVFFEGGGRKACSSRSVMLIMILDQGFNSAA